MRNVKGRKGPPEKPESHQGENQADEESYHGLQTLMPVRMLCIGGFIPESHSHEKGHVRNGIREAVNAVRQNRLAVAPISRTAFERGEGDVQPQPR